MVGPSSNLTGAQRQFNFQRKWIGSRTLVWRHVLSVLFLSAISIVTLGPVIYIIFSSFNIAEAGEDFQFGLTGWIDTFANQGTWRATSYSILLTIRVPIGIAFAFFAAWLLIRVEVPGGRLIEMIFWFGYFLPTVPILTGWILLLDEDFGLINRLLIGTGLVDESLFSIYSMSGIIWVHLTVHTIPVMVILISPALRQIDMALDEAAIVAGASPFTVMRRIVIPISLPALYIAGTASFIKALESFEVEQILGVPAGIYVYANQIYDLVNNDPPRFSDAMALSSMFLIVLILLSTYYQLYLRKKAKTETLSGRSRSAPGEYPRRLKLWGAIILFTYLAISVILPFFLLIAGSFMRIFGFIGLESTWTSAHWVEVFSDPGFARSTMGTLKLGLISAGAATMIYSVIAVILVHGRIWGRATASFLVWLPWAFPGLILGVALLDFSLNTPGFMIFYGTMVPLVIGIVIKDMPIGVHMMRLSISQTRSELIDAAKISGAGTATIFGRIMLPLSSPALVAVFLLVFSLAVKEIGTLILIAPPQLETLSLLMFKYASISEFESASVIGTIVAFISLALSVLAYRAAARAGIMR